MLVSEFQFSNDPYRYTKEIAYRISSEYCVGWWRHAQLFAAIVWHGLMSKLTNRICEPLFVPLILYLRDKRIEQVLWIPNSVKTFMLWPVCSNEWPTFRFRVYDAKDDFKRVFWINNHIRGIAISLAKLSNWYKAAFFFWNNFQCWILHFYFALLLWSIWH